MVSKKSRNSMREMRHARIRRQLHGTEAAPRLSVFRSNTGIYAQIIDDDNKKTLVSASSLDKDLKLKNGSNIEAASKVGESIAKKAKEAGITKVVFDRGGYLYHGRVKALADAASSNGLELLGGKNMQKQTNEAKNKEFEELVVEVKSVTKVTKGGRNRRFSAIVVIGDRKGKVGLGTGKASEVPDAIKKAIQAANKNLITVPLVEGRTIPHEVVGRSGAARVMLKPAKEGTGVIAGGSVRAILDLVGVRDVVSKSLGARTKLNMAEAAMNGLKSMKTIEEVAQLRGKKEEEILG